MCVRPQDADGFLPGTAGGRCWPPGAPVWRGWMCRPHFARCDYVSWMTWSRPSSTKPYPAGVIQTWPLAPRFHASLFEYLARRWGCEVLPFCRPCLAPCRW